MNFIAAMLLIILPTDYEAFIALTYLLEELNWRCVYLDNTPKLQSLVKAMMKKIKDEIPKIYSHLIKNDVTN